jgi:hypothetical protein
LKYYNLTNTKDSLYLQEQAVHARQCSFNFFRDNQRTIELDLQRQDIFLAMITTQGKQSM